MNTLPWLACEARKKLPTQKDFAAYINHLDDDQLCRRNDKSMVEQSKAK